MNQPPRLHAGMLRPCPGSEGQSPYIKQAPTTSAPRLPGDWTLCTLFPPAHSRNASPRGPLKRDSMDFITDLGVTLVWLVLLMSGRGVNAQSSPGSPSAPPEGNNADICLLPPDEGICRALFRRYYYDRLTQTCRQFFYGGCEGNANNFRTLEDCDEACGRIEKVPHRCRLEVSKGQCGVRTGKYFFNLSSMTCEKFISGECPNNKNSFPDKDTCMAYCAPKKSPSFCYSPKDGGECSGNVTRYYFNRRHKACEAFTYTGCGGNDNNFDNIEDCTRVCLKERKKEKNEKIPDTILPMEDN
ncbi:tissue factor pathway inhibitor 2 isoform X1 [Mustela nigripes]|uniref:tissue factor pathway inhibitor 2 isoform X1 n=1 Tax=Mustela nigripes TaxID=77151 RepID=UPI0028162DCF|nr:tissue factor pathway inhibitor 2 isoform X1 [Mustela nigripes]